MKNIQNLLKQAINIYEYGSIVYGTYQEGISDKDFVVVMPDETISNGEQVSVDNEQYTFHSESEWVKMLADNDVCSVECACLPQKHIVKQTKVFPVKFETSKIRSQFSAKASNSWVKCKKKLTVKEDFAPRVGKKSLWHSLRILMFGIQLLQFGRIERYTCANGYHNDIVNSETDDWNYFHEKYKPVYNKLKSDFRNLEKHSILDGDKYER